jgi:hypothetical protein
VNALVDLDMHKVRIEDGGFLRKADDHLPLGRARRCRGKGFAGSCQVGHGEAGGAGDRHPKRLATRRPKDCAAALVRHLESPFEVFHFAATRPLVGAVRIH